MFDELYEYLKKLQRHDWTYDWSDCHATWNRGRDNHKLLVAEARVNPEKMRLYLAFNTCYTYNLPNTLNDIEALRETINSVIP
jgi:hypothetical protein